MDAEVQILLLRLAASGCLLLFVGTIGFMLWRDFHLAAAAGEGWLTVIESDDQHVEKGQRWPLRKAAYFVPEEHLQIGWHGGQWWLEELQAGTLNGEVPSVPIVLQDGDTIAFQGVVLLVELS